MAAPASGDARRGARADRPRRARPPGFYPALIKGAFDAFDGKDRRALAYGPLFVIVVTSVQGFALFGQTVLTNRVVTRIEADMQAALYGHLIDADLAQLGRESPAAFTQRFTTDFLFIKEALTRLSTVLLRDVAMLIAPHRRADLDRSPDPRGGGDGAVRRLADRPDRQEAAPGLHHDAGADGPDGEPHHREPAGRALAKTYASRATSRTRAPDAFDAVRVLKMKAANARGRLDPLLEVGGGFAVAAVLVLIGWRIMSGERTVGDFTGYVPR